MWMGMYMCMHVYMPAFTAPSWKAPVCVHVDAYVHVYACVCARLHRPLLEGTVGLHAAQGSSRLLLPTSYFLLPTSYFLLGTVGLHAAGGSSRLLALRVVGVGWVGA